MKWQRIGYIILIVALSVPIHEFTHSTHVLLVDGEWAWPMFGPWQCGYGPTGIPGVACVEFREKSSESILISELLAYWTQVMFILTSLIVPRKS